MSHGSVIVLGSTCIDLVAYTQREPSPGQSVIGDNFSVVLGGKGSNQAIAAARAGSKSTLISCIGQDVFSDFAKDSLSSSGVSTSHVFELPDSTGVAHIRVDSSGQNNIVVIPLASSKISEHQIASAFQENEDADTLLLQLEIPWELNAMAIDRARSLGMRIVLDPAPANALPDDAWDGLDIVTPNESEASAITGVEVSDVETAIQAGKWFIEMGVNTALVTLGDKGVVLVQSELSRHYPAFAVKAVDTTAAGDAFAGFLGAALSQGEPLGTAISLSVAAASLSVMRIGASTSLPTRQEVDALMSGWA